MNSSLVMRPFLPRSKRNNHQRHPLLMTNATFNDRFWFLDEDQRAVLKSIWIDRDTHKSDMMVDIIRELADKIDSDAEWERINRLTPEEVDAELRAAGVDPKAVRKRGQELKGRLTKMVEQIKEDKS